tara:strand:+ start:3466 stop:4101 length:636 start_codon:yes stop_codon:yes gene_type:complete
MEPKPCNDTTAIVIGNGESRANIDLSQFVNQYILIGCNAVHRDVPVNHLVCCDRRMIEESLESPNTSNTKIYVRKDYLNYYSKLDTRIKLLPEIPYIGESKLDKPINWGSGPYALIVSANLPSDKIIMLGFDLYGKNNSFNNIYKDTAHYQTNQSKPIDHSYWEYQIAKVFANYPQKQFIIYNTENWKIPSKWNMPNVTFKVLATKNLTFA